MDECATITPVVLGIGYEGNFTLVAFNRVEVSLELSIFITAGYYGHLILDRYAK